MAQGIFIGLRFGMGLERRLKSRACIVTGLKRSICLCNRAQKDTNKLAAKKVRV